MRLQKYLAHCGVASRRAAEEWIRAGRVRVNGHVVEEMGRQVDPEIDRIEVDGRPVVARQADVYLVLHKPTGVVSSAKDWERGRVSVVKWVRDRGGPAVRIFPVGRLDVASEGLILLTNDGRLASGLLHPSHEVPRTYRATVAGQVGKDALVALAHGVPLEDGPTAKAEVRVVGRAADRSILEIRIHEGRKRQVRRMCQAVGHPVIRLVRTAMGPLSLGRLRPGEWRPLEAHEVDALYRAASLAPAGAGRFTRPGDRANITDKTQHGRTVAG